MAKDDSEGVPSERAERIARRQAADRLRGEERRRREAIAKQQAEKEASESDKCQPGQQLQSGSPAQATDKPPLRRLETAYRPPTRKPNLDSLFAAAWFGGWPVAAYLFGGDVWYYADWALLGGILFLGCVLSGVGTLRERIFEWWEYRTGKCWDERAIVYCAACNLERVQILVRVRKGEELSRRLIQCESGIIERHWIRGCGQTVNVTLSARERLPDSAKNLWRSGAKGLLSGGKQNP